MQITLPKTSQEERDVFFRKNKWLIHRLWGIRVCLPYLVDSDNDDDNNSGAVLNKHSEEPTDEHTNCGDSVDKALANAQKDQYTEVEDIEEELEKIEEEIEDILEDIEEEIEEMNKENLSAKEIELTEDLSELVDDIQDTLDNDDVADSESDNNGLDDLTRINGLGPKTADKLIEAGITSFQQIAELGEEEIEVLGEKIRNFAQSFRRNNFKQQAKDLL